MKVALLTGGGDKPYALGLLSALVSRGVVIDFIANDEMSVAHIVKHKNVNVLNFRGDQSASSSKFVKIVRVLRYYLRLVKYSLTTDTKIFHILWLNKFVLFDRMVLNMFYKACGKKLVFTAHNVDERERDGGQSLVNKWSLKVLYAVVDHIFVHTTQMKAQLIRDYGIAEAKISTIHFGINNTLPKSGISKCEARKRLSLSDNHKVLLFFGNIAPYKGLEYLLHAMDCLSKQDDNYRLIVAGQIKDCQPYWKMLERLIADSCLGKYLLLKIEYIPDSDVEVLFNSADLLILPYKYIYQSGVLFLSYSFGLPVVATDVGSLREDIQQGRTGMICKAEDSNDLAKTIERYFESDLYGNLDQLMKDIVAYGNERYSWDGVGIATQHVYKSLETEDHPVRI